MSRERRLRILAELAASGDGDVTTAQLCEVSRKVVGVTGAGIIIFSDDVPVGSVCTASAVSALVEELQYTLGEGPCVDAHHHGRPVLEPDLANPAEARWMAFTGPAVDAGVRAIFGFPVAIGAERLGALNLYVDRPGPLTEDQHADALVMAAIAAETLLAVQAKGSFEALTSEFAAGSNFHSVVHQAAGMVSVQLGVSTDQALVRVRAHAFAAERSITDVASDVVARRLRFGDDNR